VDLARPRLESVSDLAAAPGIAQDRVRIQRRGQGYDCRGKRTRSIFSKLDVRSRPEAVRVARAAGFRPPEHPEINGNGKPAAVPIRPRARAGGDRPPARLLPAGSGSALQALSEPDGSARRRGTGSERPRKAAPVNGDGEAFGEHR